MPHVASEHDMQSCIDACQGCHRLCLETIQYCLKKNEKHSDPRHIRVLMNCAQICQTSADFMLSGSEFHPQLCVLCADICQACEDSCNEVDSDDAQMKACAEACRKCAESCRVMSGHVSLAA